MARGVNKVILIGHVGKDPELRYMPAGGGVVNLSIATGESWKDKQTGETHERTEWHSVLFFNKLAEIVAQYIRKGSRIYVEGALRTRKWQDKSGQDRYTTEIVVRDMQMLDTKSSGNGSDYAAARGKRSEPEAAPANDGSEPPFEDDDIPF